MKHNCRRSHCDTTPRNYEWDMKQTAEILKKRQSQECEHGFLRLPGSPWDCSECVAKEARHAA